MDSHSVQWIRLLILVLIFKIALDLLKNHNFTFKTKKGQLQALRILVGADSILQDTLEYELLLGGREYGEPR